MRTTVELSDSVYKRLRAAAAERGTRGFSGIVEEALIDYLALERRRGEIAEDIAAAAGTWSDEDVARFERERREAWDTWRDDPSSTPTS